MKQIMKPLYLQFNSQQNAIEILSAKGFELSEDGKLYHPNCETFEIGVMYATDHILVDESGEQIGEHIELPGYHINLLVPDDFVPPQSEYILDVQTPSYKWAGY